MERNVMPNYKTVSVGQKGSDIEGFDNNAIEKAIELAGPGGRVYLSPGDFILHRPISPVDGMTLIGSGEETRLKKKTWSFCRLAADADYNQRHILVTENPGFTIGDAIAIYDEARNQAWEVTLAIITDINVTLDGFYDIYLNCYLEQDYRKEITCIAHVFSLISVENKKNVFVKDLSVIGDVDHPHHVFLNGCRGGGIYIYRSSDCLVENVTVDGFAGDGISWQTTRNIVIRNCSIKNCLNFGLHPGAGSQYSKVIGCTIKNNQQTGLYLCWRVKMGYFRNNTIFHNRYGISIGHRDNDNIFRDNKVYENAEAGVLMRKEDEDNKPSGNLFAFNDIYNNGAHHTDEVVGIEHGRDNIFYDNQNTTGEPLKI